MCFFSKQENAAGCVRKANFGEKNSPTVYPSPIGPIYKCVAIIAIDTDCVDLMSTVQPPSAL